MNQIGLEGAGRRILMGEILFSFAVLVALMGSFVPPAQAESGTLLAYEPFGETRTRPLALNGASGGGDEGWGTAWVEQMGSTAVPGYNIASQTPLTYSGLITTAGYATGGFGYQNAGRALNVTASGPFASWLSGGLIDAPGQSLWISFLLRQNLSGATPNVGLSARGGGAAWWTSPPNIQVGYFGSRSNNGSGKPLWSLQYSGTTVLSSVPVVTGQTVLFVIEDTFGSGGPDQINLYINPSSLGSSPPPNPTLQYSPSGSTAFQSLTYYGGDTPGQSSLGDLRIGTSYSAVKPIPPMAPIAAGFTDTRWVMAGAVLLFIAGGALAFRTGRIQDRALRLHREDSARPRAPRSVRMDPDVARSPYSDFKTPRLP